MKNFSQNFVKEDGIASAQVGNVFSAGDANNLVLVALAEAKRRVDRRLREVWRSQKGVGRHLWHAMRAGIFGGGKRLRPLLVFASADFAKKINLKKISPGKDYPLEVEDEMQRVVDDAAAAVELVHSYSLIHDDLPAMDGDLIRRGKPSVHVSFGDGQAILAGDALLTLAFEVLAPSPPFHSSARDLRVRLALINHLAVAAGGLGMVGGQSLDIGYADSSTGDHSDAESINLIHKRKTGALLCASCMLGAFCVDASESVRAALEVYGRALGFAYQIIDDLYDADVSENSSSSPQLSPCYVRAFGKEVAINDARALCNQADNALSDFGDDASLLRSLILKLREKVDDA